MPRVRNEDTGKLIPVGFDEWDSLAQMEYNDHLKKRAKIYKIYQRKRTMAKAKNEDLSSSEDEEGNKRTGYELTPYMEEYNANTAMDFTDGYDPKSLDDNFKISGLYNP